MTHGSLLGNPRIPEIKEIGMMKKMFYKGGLYFINHILKRLNHQWNFFLGGDHYQLLKARESIDSHTWFYIGGSLVSSKDSFQIYLKDISQLDLNTFEIYYRRFWEQKLMLC